MNYDYIFIGAGLFYATIAHEMTKKGKKCLVIQLQEGLVVNGIPVK